MTLIKLKNGDLNEHIFCALIDLWTEWFVDWLNGSRIACKYKISLFKSIITKNFANKLTTVAQTFQVTKTKYVYC